MGCRSWVLAVVLSSATSACAGGGSHSSDGSVDSVIELSIEWPAGCPPATGNEKGIGLPCARGGAECTKAKSGHDGLLCTCDPTLGALLAGVPCICTLAQPAKNGSTDPCKDTVSADYCGSSATCCDVLNSAAYCVPNVCTFSGACLVFVPVDGGP
jgi:hypothetical protein